MPSLQYRKAVFKDLPHMIKMLADDTLGRTREKSNSSLDKLDKRYIDAFHRIDADPNQYLMIVMLGDKIKRPNAIQFYESLGFKSTHEGMKYHI